MSNKIYIITVCEKIERSPQGWPELGSTRSPGFYLTLEDAKYAVENNLCDIWETCYNYAFIEEIEPGMYSNENRAGDNLWYKYNVKEDRYENIAPPHFPCICGLGPIG